MTTEVEFEQLQPKFQQLGLKNSGDEHQQFLQSYATQRQELHKKQRDEPLLKENKKRLVMYPIKYHDRCNMYKKAEASVLTA